MAILESRTQTGMSWVKESLAIFKRTPRKWLLLALTYVGLFMILPSLPGFQILSFACILLWPVFLAISAALYRNAELGKEQKLSEIMRLLQPKMTLLMGLGIVCLVYLTFMGLLLNADFQGLAAMAHPKVEMTDSEKVNFAQKLLPVMLKILLLSAPILMVNWFAPMLIAFNNYPLVKAMKSSIAGSLQYMVALSVAWLMFTLGIATLIIPVAIISAFAQSLGELLLIGCLLLATALTLAFQYVSYRDVFRAVI